MKILAKRLLWVMLFVDLCCAGAMANDYANNLATLSVTPYKDGIELRQARRHLDSVRRAEHRPTVALVLCGGGAKGASQIGVMKVIEELDIPIDFICGTSIGGLLGGLFAMGYDAAFVEDLMRNADWAKMLSDKIDQENSPLTHRLYKSKYQLSFPFHYEDKAADTKIRDKERKGDLSTQSGIDALASSLPSGIAFGLNVNNLLSSVSVGYHDSTSFANLPIPFYCVATEMVSCKTKYWGSGDLKKAMRSTMSIPGLFTPVRTQGLVLCDGGSRNNFPVDIAKAVGADIIIGIDLSDPYLTVSTINNVGTIMGQYFNMLGRESYERTRKMPDVYIHPDLHGYGMMSFETEAVDSMIRRGYEAGMKHYGELLKIKKKVGNASRKLCRRPAVDINRQSVELASVRFDGIPQTDAKVLLRKTGLHLGDKVCAEDLENAVAFIQGTGAVESVSYSLHGKKEPYNLVFNCVSAPTDRFGVGLRLDSEVWADLALHYGWNVNKLFGPKINLHGRLGISQSLYAKFSWDFGKTAVNFDAVISNYNVRFKSAPYVDYFSMDMSYWTHQEKIFFSLDDYYKFNFSAGLRNRYFNITRTSQGLLLGQELSIGNYLGVYANLKYGTLDRQYFPNSGLEMRADISCDFTRPGNDTFSPIVAESFDIKGVVPCCDFFAIIPDFHLRWIQDRYSNPVDASGNAVREFSLCHRNCFGGTIPGRYFEQQIPFCGMDHISLCTLSVPTAESCQFCDDVAVLNLDFRFNVAKNWYVSAMGGYVHMAQNLKSFFRYNEYIRDIFGAAVQGSYSTLFGPISVRLNWCNRTGVFKDDWGFYISAGFDF